VKNVAVHQPTHGAVLEARTRQEVTDMVDEFDAGVPLTAAEWILAPAEIQGLGAIDVEEVGFGEQVDRWMRRLVSGFAASPEADGLTRFGWIEELLEVSRSRSEDVRRFEPSDAIEAAMTAVELKADPKTRGGDVARELKAFFRYCGRELGMRTGEECAESFEDPRTIDRLCYAVEPDDDVEPEPLPPPRIDRRPLAKVLPFRRPTVRRDDKTP
jgi:hypothetical protein